MSEPTRAVTPDHKYGSLTKSLDIDETLMLLSLAHELGSASTFKKEGLARLTQTSRVRRQEILRLTLHKFLTTEGDQIVATPLLRILVNPSVESVLKRQVLYVQYLRSTPLVWDAVAQIVLPQAQASNPATDGTRRGELQIEDWNGFLTRKLRMYTPATLSRTRRHITAHLTKFGVLEAEQVEGNAIAKRFYARLTEPDPKAFLFGLAAEFDDHGWTSRALDWVMVNSWARIAFCTSPTYVRFAVEQGEHLGLVIPEYFGSQRQVTLMGSDPVAKVAEVLLQHP